MSHDQPTVIVDSGATYSFKDIMFPGFQLRFVKQGEEWVCSMPEWLLDQAVVMASEIGYLTEQVKYLESQVYGGTTK